MSVTPGAPDPLWYKDAIIYELHVRAFSDSNGDGVGDFAGLTGRLDYLRDLGVNTLWVLPFYPSPLRDDGYDISDYTQVHPQYGTLADFRTFLEEAHQRDLRVITELVLNHTSDQHPWFQRARRSPAGSRWRDWYVWSETNERYRDARVIFKDFEPSNWSWDHVAKAYYWHRFYSHQPDLNFDHPEVHQALFEVVDFWLEMGVDGFRLDAIPYLYEREGTSCDNLPETHAFLRKLRKHVDERYPNRVLLAEANLWPEEAVTYFGRGDECNMAFHFPIMARMFLAVHQEDRYPLTDILAQTPQLPEAAQWALFLRNHDELTLEMVTEEERNYMYRCYARERQARINLGIRRRLAPLLQNSRKKIELLNSLLFSLPGTPVVYYGDEIGMGDNIFLGDRNAVRTPMQWSGDRNAGFSRANAQQVYLPVVVDPEYHYEAVNVEAQQTNPQSLLWWMKRLLALSRRWKAFGRGSIELLAPDNRKVMAFLRRYEDELILVVANLSRFSQYVELDLGPCAGRLPVELFGRTEFPKIGETPYLLTLGPHAFYWFALQAPEETATTVRQRTLGRPLEVSGSWDHAFLGKARPNLERLLEASLPGRPWFGTRSRRAKSVRITRAGRFAHSGREFALVFFEAEFYEGEPEHGSLPVAFVEGADAEGIRKESPAAIIAQVRVRTDAGEKQGLLVDAGADPGFHRAMAELLARPEDLELPQGKLSVIPSPPVPKSPEAPASGPRIPEGTLPAAPPAPRPPPPTLVWFHRLEEGPDPDLEAAEFFARAGRVLPILPLGGSLEYRPKSGSAIPLGLFRGFPPGSRDAWAYTQDELGRYFEFVRSTPGIFESMAQVGSPTAFGLAMEPASELQGILGQYLESAGKMGDHTAVLHRQLMTPDADSAFKPEPISSGEQRAIYQSLRKKLVRVLPLLRRTLRYPAWAGAGESKRIQSLEQRLLEAFRPILERHFVSFRIRAHGDLSLHRLASTGAEFVFTDWAGPAAGSFHERRMKRSALWDVAGMVNSFRKAAQAALESEVSSGEGAPERWPILWNGAAAWYASASVHYLRKYFAAMEGCPCPLGSREEMDLLLRSHLLERILEDLGSSLEGRSHASRVVIGHLSDLFGVLDLFRPEGVSPDPEELKEWAAWIRSATAGTLPKGPVRSAPPPREPAAESPIEPGSSRTP